jgi:hypothetical protein
MPFSPEQFKPVSMECPFLNQPCPQGEMQGFGCRIRAIQTGHGDPLVQFRNDAVVYCAVCQREISVSSIPRAAMRLDKT